MRWNAVIVLVAISACDAPPQVESPPPATSTASPTIEAPAPPPPTTPPAPSTAVGGDAVDRLVAKLDASPLWINGAFPKIDLPASTPIADVVKVVFQKVSFDGGRVKTQQLRSHRTVNIGGTAYEAVLVDTDLGQKIVLLQHQPTTGWWSRVFDA